MLLMLLILVGLITHLGPVVHRTVSLIKLKVKDLLRLLVQIKSSELRFFVKKNKGCFALQKLLTFLWPKKNGDVFLHIHCIKFELLTFH